MVAGELSIICPIGSSTLLSVYENHRAPACVRSADLLVKMNNDKISLPTWLEGPENIRNKNSEIF